MEQLAAAAPSGAESGAAVRAAAAAGDTEANLRAEAGAATAEG